MLGADPAIGIRATVSVQRDGTFTQIDRGGNRARQAALMMLPDVLRHDRGRPAVYPNGRSLTDDVYSFRFAWLSNGKIPPTGLKPHDDLLNKFPYLGLPHP